MINDPAFLRAHLERVTGLQPLIRETIDGWVASANTDDRSITVRSGDLSGLHQRFLDENFQQIRAIKLREQKGRCARCGRRGPLQLHHKILRSQVRDDRPENTELICATTCHEEEHRPTLPIAEWGRGL